MFNKGDDVAVLNDAGLVLGMVVVDRWREADRNVHTGSCRNSALSFKSFSRKTGKGCNNGMRIELWDDSKHVVDERTDLIAQYKRVSVYQLSTDTIRSILELAKAQQPVSEVNNE